MRKTSEVYRDTIVSLVTAVERDEVKSIDKAAEVLAKSVAEGRLINIIGTGGHSAMAAEEAFYRAGNLVPVNALLDAGTNLIHGARRSICIERTPGYAATVLDAYGVSSGDALIIANAYGINAMTIDCALECNKRNITSIGITSMSFAESVPAGSCMRHPSNKNLYEIVDIWINTHMPLGDASVEVVGIPQKMGPTSTLLNVFAVNLLMMRTAEKLIGIGLDAPVWTSVNLPNGDMLNEKFSNKYMLRVKHK